MEIDQETFNAYIREWALEILPSLWPIQDPMKQKELLCKIVDRILKNPHRQANVAEKIYNLKTFMVVQ